MLAAAGSERFVDLEIHPWEWAALVAFISALLVTDLLLVHRKPHEISFREAAIESSVWISIGVAFTGVIYLIGGSEQGGQAAGEYISGFLLEKSLSVDNVFIWAVIFTYFAVPRMYQFRVLFWGIFGALVLRAAFIFAGSALISRFTITLAVFGVVLLVTGFRLAFRGRARSIPTRASPCALVRRVVPSTDRFDGQQLFTIENGQRLATPLFAVLVMIESTDVVFAVDSVPAIFGVAHDPFIVFSSNAFAILGLRALYFLLGGLQDRFRYLHYGLGGDPRLRRREDAVDVLGGHVRVAIGDLPLPDVLSLGVIAAILTVTIIASLAAEKREKEASRSAAGTER